MDSIDGFIFKGVRFQIIGSLLTCKTVTTIRTSYKTQPVQHGGFLRSTTERRSQKKNYDDVTFMTPLTGLSVQ